MAKNNNLFVPKTAITSFNDEEKVLPNRIVNRVRIANKYVKNKLASPYSDYETP